MILALIKKMIEERWKKTENGIYHHGVKLRLHGGRIKHLSTFNQ